MTAKSVLVRPQGLRPRAGSIATSKRIISQIYFSQRVNSKHKILWHKKASKDCGI